MYIHKRPTTAVDPPDSTRAEERYGTLRLCRSAGWRRGHRADAPAASVVRPVWDAVAVNPGRGGHS